jgi:hypothetical protein
MSYATALKAALVIGVGVGFAAGKLDIDVKIRDAIENANRRIAKINAQAMADELEGRKLAVAPLASDEALEPLRAKLRSEGYPHSDKANDYVPMPEDARL